MTLKELEQRLEDLYKEAVELHEGFEQTPEFQSFEFNLLNVKIRSIWCNISNALAELRRLEVNK